MKEIKESKESEEKILQDERMRKRTEENKGNTQNIQKQRPSKGQDKMTK